MNHKLLKNKENIFSVAPMMEWTVRHQRYLMRLISRHSLLYTEMIPTGALVHGDHQRFLAFDPFEHPVAVQLGGSDVNDLVTAAKRAAAAGYDEVNLNVGCPSDRVQSGRFGACLMAEPDLVASAVAAMSDAVAIPVTVKCRIGIDDQPDTALDKFVEAVAAAGCRTFIVHARKAWLKGLSPKQNREIPPLRYDLVYRLKQQRPDLLLVLNGGISSLAECERHLECVDGVMLGRWAYQHPFGLSEVDRRFFNDHTPPRSRREVIDAYLPYVERECAAGTPLRHITQHMLGLTHGLPGARAWRRHLCDQSGRAGAGPEVIAAAARLVDFGAERVAA